MFDVEDYENAKGCLGHIKDISSGDFSFNVEISGDVLYEINKLLNKIVKNFEQDHEL